MACENVGADTIIDLKKHLLLLSRSLFDVPFRKLVTVALRSDLTLELSSMPFPHFGGAQFIWAPPQGESLGLNLDGIQLVPAGAIPDLSWHISLVLARAQLA